MKRFMAKNKLFNNLIVKILSLLIFILVLTGAAFYKGDLPTEYLEDKYTSEQSKFIIVKGVRTHYRIEGNISDSATKDTQVNLSDKSNVKKPYLILVHGTGASLHTWDIWTEILKQHFIVVRLDLPAFGLTGPNPQRDYSLDYYVDFLNEFTDKLGLAEFSIAGNSLGGGIAWSFTTKHQDKVKKLILLNSSGLPKADIPMVFALARNPISAFFLRYTTSKSFIKKNIQQVYFDDNKISDALVERYWELGLREGNRQAFVDRANLAFVYSTELLSVIRVPTLIMWGEEDEWIPVADAQVLGQLIENSQLIIYPGVGHVPMEEIPEQTAKDSLSFLLQE